MWKSVPLIIRMVLQRGVTSCASRLLCGGGGHYTEALGLSSAGELGWDVFLWRWVFKTLSKITLGCIVWPSFKWLFLAASMWMWNLSSIFRWVPFLWRCSICIMLCKCQKEWASMSRCFAKLEL